MSGMNVAEVQRLGARLGAEADGLERLTRAIDATVRTAQQQWRGRDVDLFDQDWAGHTRAQCFSLVAVLRQLGESARRNAEEQVLASASEASAGGRVQPGAGATAPAGTDPQWWYDTASRLAGLGDAAGLGDHALAASRTFEKLARVFSVLDGFFAAKDMYDGARAGDWGKAGGGLADVAIMALGKTPWGAPLAVGKLFADVAIPYTAERQEACLDYFAESTFGKARGELTPEEADILSDAFTGPTGAMGMMGCEIMRNVAEAERELAPVMHSLPELRWW